MPSSTTVPHGNNDSPIVGSMPISKTDLLKEPSEELRRMEGSNCSMPWQDGLRQWTWLYGHMHYVMQCIFTTLYRCSRMGFHDWNSLQAPK
eukprot:CCRYP_011927-RA/>CCRYP_011927-RA protein AED:0.25 eAED:1.00 QI:0/-1/0/1/-1/0/1/0/90